MLNFIKIKQISSRQLAGADCWFPQYGQVSAQMLDVNTVLFYKAHFCQVSGVLLGAVPVENQGVDSPGGELSVQVGPDGAVPVGGGGVIQAYPQYSGAAICPQQNAGGISAAADNVGPVHPGTL